MLEDCADYKCVQADRKKAHCDKEDGLQSVGAARKLQRSWTKKIAKAIAPAKV
jgi:hypothetical protein